MPPAQGQPLDDWSGEFASVLGEQRRMPPAQGPPLDDWSGEFAGVRGEQRRMPPAQGQPLDDWSGEFAGVLGEQLESLGAVLLLHHRQAVALLRSELSEERDPSAWLVPEEPLPQPGPVRPGRAAFEKGSTRATLERGSSRATLERIDEEAEGDHRAGTCSYPTLPDDASSEPFRRHALSGSPDLPQITDDRQSSGESGPRGVEGEDCPSESTAEKGPARHRFAPLDVWARSDQPRQRTLHSLGPYRGASSKSDVQALGHGEQENLPSCALARLVMMRPTSRARLAWSMASLVLLSYDVVMVPIDVFFDVPPSVFFKLMEWTSLLFWMSDLLLNFATGVERDGVLEMRPHVVALEYAKKWLLLDLVLVLAEWLVLLVPSFEGFEAIAMLRAARFLRLLRILRIARLSRLIDDLMLFLPDAVLLSIGVLKAFFAFAVLLHFLACLWHGMGEIEIIGWVHAHGLSDLDVPHRYIYAVCWSVAQLHGFSLVPLRTAGELTLASICGVVGFLVLSVCVVKTTDALDSTEAKQKVQMHRLCRHYVRNRNVSGDLLLRLRKHVGQSDTGSKGKNLDKLTLRDRIEYEDTMVRDLPVALQVDLHEEVRKPLLEMQQLCQHLHIAAAGTPVLRALCHQSIVCEAALVGELVFTLGEACSNSRIVEAGKVVYVRWPGVTSFKHPGNISVSNQLSQFIRRNSISSLESLNGMTSGPGDSDEVDNVQQADEVELQRGTHVSEVRLWTTWEHCGMMLAVADSTMLSIDAALFATVISSHNSLLHSAQKFAVHLTGWMNSLPDDEVLTDLLEAPDGVVPTVSHEELRNPRDHLIFISHFKKEAGTEATLLEEGFQRLISSDPLHPANDFRRPVFLDSQDLVDLSSLERYVRHSHNLILLLTPEVLTRPWCLLEIVTALKLGIEVVPVEISRPGLSFTYPTEDFFKELVGGRVLPPQDEALLLSRDVELRQLEGVRKVFQKIALPFSPHKSGRIREAELMEILSRCSLREGRVPGSPPHGPPAASRQRSQGG